MRWIILVTLLWSGQAWAGGYQEIEPRQPIVGTVDFNLYRGYLIVAHGSAGPVKGLTFVVDTGASPTVLDPWVAQKLHLAESPASIQVLGGRVQAKQATVPSLSLGPLHRQNLPVLIEDLSFMGKALPFRVDGVVGLDVLSDGAFLIDYVSQTIHFGPYPELSNSLALRMKDGLAIVDAEVNGQPASLLVDTGASGLTLFVRNAAPAVKVTSIGQYQHQQIQARSVRLGKAEFKRESISVVGGGAGYAFDGLLSPAALGITRLAIDIGRGEIEFGR